MGFETAKSLAVMNPKRLILACRNAEKANAAVAKIKDELKFENVEAWHLDLASFKSVTAFAQRYNDLQIPLDIFISNAGVVSRSWTETENSLEVTYAVPPPPIFIYVYLLHIFLVFR